MALRMFAFTWLLWIATLSWGVGLGAKLFDLLVVAGAWGASPPASFALLPYGPAYPLNPGAFFQPLSIVMAVSIVGALIAGWGHSRPMRVWLWIGTLSFVAIWAITPTVFWPMINQQYDIATGKLTASVAEATALTARWYAWDWFRVCLIALGFVASVRAISLGTALHQNEIGVSSTLPE
ncbi:anthrone oxygenase family protein [Chiayiivirga flava]|uniref:DUF1772 domain-containing protein n=1 Tax=Chiayiivirga flava TaxID=659595 RepID=A0A7W8D831_9GAMM|nr:DUF1772 domain-containing protein [Chiayiivirga flava]MBB5209644.1 hypothetical protein [Chiayiivirga flava]